MAHISSGETDFFSDEAILGFLEESRTAYEGGDKSALMMCVFRCAAFQAVIPEWASDALIELRENLEVGRVKDFNEAFGTPAEKVSTRAARARIQKMTPLVLAVIQQLRTQGHSFNDSEMFGIAVENLRAKGFNVNHRDVQTIYRSVGSFLKALPRGIDPAGIHGFAMGSFPKARRYGRPILRDEEAD